MLRVVVLSALLWHVLGAPTLPSMTTNNPTSTSVTASTTTAPTPTASSPIISTTHQNSSTHAATASPTTSTPSCWDACSVCRCDNDTVDCAKDVPEEKRLSASTTTTSPTSILLRHVPCGIPTATTYLCVTSWFQSFIPLPCFYAIVIVCLCHILLISNFNNL